MENTTKTRAEKDLGEVSKLDSPLKILIDAMGSYDVHGLEEEIRRRYRKLAKEIHPDVNASPTATRDMQLLSQAYESFKEVFQYLDEQGIGDTVTEEHVYFAFAYLNPRMAALIVDEKRARQFDDLHNFHKFYSIDYDFMNSDFDEPRLTPEQEELLESLKDYFSRAREQLVSEVLVPYFLEHTPLRNFKAILRDIVNQMISTYELTGKYDKETFDLISNLSQQVNPAKYVSRKIADEIVPQGVEFLLFISKIRGFNN